MNMNIGIFMNAWISYLSILWTHEFHFWKIHEPMNMNTNITMNSWIWISNFSWTHEYEYGHVTPWTFKSSYSSWNFMNHAMNSMNCNAWLWLLFAALSQNCELPIMKSVLLIVRHKKIAWKKNKWKKILGQTKSVGEWFFYLFMGDKCCLHLWLNKPEYFFFLGSVFFFIFRYISTTKSALRCMFCLQQSANACFESSI